jgi:restriction system protein
MSFKSSLKGWFGEIQGTLAKKIFLDPSIYIDVNNVTISATNGTTQIDHIIVSCYGVFVIETKNMSGWIFGDEKSPQWTQSFAKKRFKFQNPLHQNYRHTRALSEFLDIEHDKFFSVIMFWGTCEFKTSMPSNVIKNGYTDYIKSKKIILFSNAEVETIVSKIRLGRLPKNVVTQREHISSLKKRVENTKICPKCGNQLVLRTAKSGINVGSPFYGCTKYPYCRYIGQIK